MKHPYIFLFLLGCSEFSIADTVTFATWNLEWQRSALLNQAQFEECEKIKPSDRENLDNNHPYRWTCKSPAQITQMQVVAKNLDADVVAVQEVESYEALQQIWPADEYNLYVNMKSPWIQRTGFVVRKSSGLKVEGFNDIPGLGLAFKDHSRNGAELALERHGKTLKLLSVHLKSGCFDQALNSGFSTKRDKKEGVVTCDVLKNQAKELEAWLDNAITSGVSAIIIGDFNRRFDADIEKEIDPKVSLFAELSDEDPPNAKLFRPTTNFVALPACQGGGSKWLIDHALMTRELEANFVVGSLLELNVPMKGSDHCPLSFKMEL